MMRDPTRIPKVLATIQHVWEKHPDLRLGQLLSNAAGPTVDLFFIEDNRLADFVAKLESMLDYAKEIVEQERKEKENT